jgi:subtilase family serine protease
MSNHRTRLHTGTGIATLLAIVTLMATSGFSQSADSHVLANSTSSLIANAQNLGPEDASKEMTVTVWLHQHNKTALDSLVHQMYDRSSPNYHHWLTMEQYNARFAPSAREAATVRDFLADRGLKVSAIHKNNYFLTAKGRVGDIQKAFNVQINNFNLNGEIHRANTSNPSIQGPAGALVAAVQGLTDLGYKSHVSRPVDPETGESFEGVPLSSTEGPNGLVFNGNCFRKPQTVTFKTSGGSPMALYSGNRYGSNITSAPPNKPPCGYDSAEIQKAYGLKDVYKAKWKGKGQTIVIVDAFGSNTILADANAFSQMNKLPALTASNFQIFTPNGPTTCGAACIAGNWQFETTLDVEWAHSIAPEANIALVLGADNSFTNLDIANLFAIDNLLGSVISNSFGIPELILVDFLPSELIVENNLAELAAALGMSQQVSTGDAGDNLIFDQVNFGVNSASAGGGTSPFETAIGGTSLFLNPDRTIEFQTGWGNNETRIANRISEGSTPVIPPLSLGFVFGGGGGASTFFAKPSFQKSLPGKTRLTPDVAFLGDPETGVELVITPTSVPNDPQVIEVIGGTSLACPMFSALWAIANQAAGIPLGQAAPYLYALPPGDLTDILQIGSPFDPAGIIFNPPNPPAVETPDALAAPLGNTVNYVSALYNSPFSTRWFVITFGTDTSLTTGTGWDNVTGLGTPNGLSFIQGVVALSEPAAH